MTVDRTDFGMQSGRIDPRGVSSVEKEWRWRYTRGSIVS